MKATGEEPILTDNVYPVKETPPVDKGSANGNVIDVAVDVRVPDNKGAHGSVATFVTVYDGAIKRIRVLSVTYKLSYPESDMPIIAQAVSNLLFCAKAVSVYAAVEL